MLINHRAGRKHYPIWSEIEAQLPERKHKAIYQHAMRLLAYKATAGTAAIATALKNSNASSSSDKKSKKGKTASPPVVAISAKKASSIGENDDDDEEEEDDDDDDDEEESDTHENDVKKIKSSRISSSSSSSSSSNSSVSEEPLGFTAKASVPWTEEDKRSLLSLVASEGRVWAHIGRLMGGRTPKKALKDNCLSRSHKYMSNNLRHQIL